VWRDQRRAAKKRARAIEYARSRPNRVQHYRELIRLTRATLAYADQAAMQLWQAPDPIAAALWQAEFGRYRPLIERIIAQTERRVFQGETVAASEKTGKPVPVGDWSAVPDEGGLITRVGGADNDECVIPTIPLTKLRKPGDV
jgi:hypothetical protein